MKRAHLERYFLLLILGILGAAWIFYSRESVQDQMGFGLTEAPIVGHLAPDFTLTTAVGESMTLTDYIDREGGTGKPVVINFWASWCGPCRLETPHFQDVSLKYDDQIAVLGINQGESLATIVDFGTSFGLTYPLLHDPASTVNQEYGIMNLPTTVFIDANGVVREVFVGALSQAVLEERINGLLDSR